MELLFEGTWESIQKEMREMLGGGKVSADVETLKPTGPVEKAAKKAAPVATPTPPVQPTSTPVAPPAAEGFDYKKIEQIIPQALEIAGRSKVVALLEKYGAKKGSELKTTDYAAFYAECQTLVDAASLA